MISEEPRTKRIERNRTHYARSEGDTAWTRVDEPLAVDLGLPTSYARSLLAELQKLVSEDGVVDQVEIAVDLPVRLYLRPLQVEQLIAKLEEAAR